MARKARWLVLGALAAMLVACGGGGATSGCSNLDPTRSTDLPGCAAATGAGQIAAPDASVTASTTAALALTDASGAAISSVAPDRAGTLRATLKDAHGNALSNFAVTFTSSDKTGAFVPASGTALTDAAGIARVGLAAGTQAGAYTASAGAMVGSTPVSATVSYAVAFPTLTLSALNIAPATLSAGGNAGIGVLVSAAQAPYTPPLPVFFTSPCIATGKATIVSPVLTQGGTATASYVDKGCGVADIITASVTLGDASVTRTGIITVLPASAGSIKFSSATTTNIALKGTGGFGRQEFSTLTFNVVDKTGMPLAGSLIDLAFSDSNSARTVGGLTLNPAVATSGADGSVTALVSAGTIPTSVRVVASVRGSVPLITTLSNMLVISTGVPNQRHFSLSTEFGNCEGWDFDQSCSVVTATLGDHFGNPVPDGTAVNFTTEGGIIDASCVTGSLPAPGATPTGQSTNSKVGPGSGTCSVLLRASSPRPANGHVTVLAYAIGEENFDDMNGNNVFDGGDTYLDKSPDIFRDDDESGAWTPGEPCIGPNLNGLCSTPGDGAYNGVLRMPQVSSAQTLYVSAQLVQTFSGSGVSVGFAPPAPACVAGGSVDVRVTPTDVNGNLMPAGTIIDFQAIFGTESGTVFPVSIKVPNVVLAVGETLTMPSYTVTVGCKAGSGKLVATVTTPITKTITTARISIN